MVETVILVAIGVVCGAVLGFWLGRISARYYAGGSEAEEEDNTEGLEEAPRSNKSRKNERTDRYDWEGLESGISQIGSPVSGVVTDYRDGKRPEILICPDGEKLYAPAAGKIIRLFPLGNEMLFRTEEGVVLRIKVGDGTDELLSDYFRPKVIQNEVVNKGKLLLEFHREGLAAEGVEWNILVRVEEIGVGDRVLGITEGSVKAGEDIFEIVGK